MRPSFTSTRGQFKLCTLWSYSEGREGRMEGEEGGRRNIGVGSNR